MYIDEEEIKSLDCRKVKKELSDKDSINSGDEEELLKHINLDFKYISILHN